MRQFDFIGNTKKYFAFSIALLVIAFAAMLIFGVQLDIQFKGGALITYSYTGEIDRNEFTKSVQELLGQGVSVQESTDLATGKQNFVVSLAASQGLTAEKQLELTNALGEQYGGAGLETVSINVVDPTIGNEFLLKSLLAVAFAAVLMIIYTSIRFRMISGWSAGVMAVAALLHDLLMVFASFILFRFPINANFIAVCLTILGYSLNDTIVIYDRVRENKRLYGNRLSVAELMNKSLNQSLKRSLMTTITTVASMVVVSVVAYIYNVESILSFSMPMIIGMLSGVYSSLCIACPLWVLWQRKHPEDKAK